MNLKIYKGQITVFLSMIFMIIVSLLITLINYVRVSSSITVINMAESMGIDSSFSAYDRELLEEFGIFAYAGGKAALQSEISSYINENLDTDESLMDISLNNLIVSRVYTVSENGGEFLERQIVDYMKYAAPIGIGEDIIKEILGIEDDTPAKQVTDKVMELTDEITEASNAVYMLMSVVDGVEVQETFIVHDGFDIARRDTFAKQLSLYDDPESLGINSMYIMDSLSGKVTNPLKLLGRIEILLIQWKQSRDEALEIELMMNIDELNELIESTYACLKEAKFQAYRIKDCSDTIDKESDEILSMLENNRDNIDEEVYEALLKEANAYRDFKSLETNQMCDTDALITAIDRNIAILEKGMFLKRDYGGSYMDWDYEKYLKNIEAFREALYGYSVSDIKIDYSNVKIFNDGGTDILRELKGIYNEGLLHMIMGDKAVSDKCIPQKYEVSENFPSPLKGVSAFSRNVMFNEYDISKFSSAVDNDAAGYLDYELEYVIGGRISDRDNLACVAGKITAIREASNFLYLLTDAKKCEEAYSLATAIAAGSGIPCLTEVTKLIILAVWAYAESVSDVRQLLNGGRVPIWKSADTFNMSFEKLMTLDMSAENRNKTGLSYEDYIRYLLFVENYGKKNIATANLMELYMIGSGNSGFCISDMIVGADVMSEYLYDRDRQYMRTSSFCY